MEEYENNTRVVFDNNLKLCIMNIPVELKENLKTMDYVALQEAQKQIRNYFVTHQCEFNVAGRLTYSYESCPDFYALLSAVTAELQHCESWNDVYNQFTSSIQHNETLYDASGNCVIRSDNFSLCNYEDEFDPKTKIVCMCSHLCCPENMSIITNRHTQLNALIACDCLDKTGIINKYNFITKAKKSDTYAKIFVKKQLEKQKKTNNTNKWETIVSKCIKQYELCRKCIDCNILSILKTEPNWKKKCLSCYGKPTGVCLLLKRK